MNQQKILNMSADEVTNKDIEWLGEKGVPNVNNFNKARNEVKDIVKLIEKGKITTILDLESWVYGGDLRKTLSTSSPNAIQAIYGRRAWDQVNREHTLFSLLRKVAWTTSGWRVITPEANDDVNLTLEDGSIPDGEDPNFVKLSVTPASIVRRNSRTDIVDVLAELDDGVSMLEIAKWLDLRHKQIINLQLLAVNENIHNTHNLWSIDRIIGSHAELAYGDVANSAVITANYLDVFGQDRDAAASWRDSQVSGQAFGSGDRVFALSHIDAVLRGIRVTGGRYNTGNMVMVTHPDTAVRIDQLCASNQRYNDVMSSVFIRGGRGGMEILGAEQRPGIEGGISVATYRGIPIFEDPNVVQDTLGRMYFIDLSTLFMAVLLPTRVYNWGGPETTSSFNIEMMYRSVMQTVCMNFRKQGKLRDLKEA